ncbi:MAG: hypothetical protein KF830_07430 [Planctomycetes bacterium]|nr:hypothetical protein [Planctomycetota bacterium]
MATRWLPLLLATWSWPAAAAQQDHGEAAQRALRRAADDALAAAQKLLAEPHAFHGDCTFRGGPWSEPEPIPFRAAHHHGLDHLHLRQHTLLVHGERQLVRTGNGDWTLPQGDAGELPFAPRVLAHHLAAAQVESATPVFVDDRPAVRLHVRWTAAAAAALLDTAAHPDAPAQRCLERLSDSVVRAAPGQTWVDAAICFDPSARTLQSVVLRAAFLPADEPRERDEPPRAPAGLPPLPRPATAEFTFVVAIVPTKDVPLPDLDEALCRRLGWRPLR